MPNILNKNKRPPSGSDAVIEQKKNLDASGWGSDQSENDLYLMNGTKLPWHKDRLLEFVKNPHNNSSVPLHIDMGIATGCNLACHFCYGVVQARTGFQGAQGKIHFMSLDTIKNVFRSSKEIGVRSIALIGEGENTLNPALYPSLDYARDINLDVSLATHGANLKEENFMSMLSALSWIRINISAATDESYKVVHQRPWFEKVIKNTESLVKFRNHNDVKLKNGKPSTIGFQMVLTHKNFNDIVPLAKLAINLGLDYLVVKACSDTPDGELDAPTEEYLQYKKVFKEAEKLSNHTTKIIVRWEKLGNLGNKSYSTCYGTKFIIAISGNGNVFPCGHWFDIEKEKFLMGNVNDNSLKNILKNDKSKCSQKAIGELDLRNCETNCRQHQINIFLDKLNSLEDKEKFIENLDDSLEPQHVNFI